MRAPLADLRTSLAIGSLEDRDAAPWVGDPRRRLAWAASVGARAVQLDATMPGLRPRELDRSARRDLAATLRREGLAFSGVDAWIPPAHLADAAHADRAVAALVQAAAFAGELAMLTNSTPTSRVASIRLPNKPCDGVIEALLRSCESSGVWFACHEWPLVDARLGAGIDPAALIAAGADPAREVARLATPILAARLTDLGASGRVVPGEGHLDLLAYVVALATSGFQGYAIVDAAGLPDPATVVRTLLGAARPVRP